jgi:predicted alpha/beta hydrolase
MSRKFSMPTHIGSHKVHPTSGTKPHTWAANRTEIKNFVHTTSEDAQLAMAFYFPERTPRAVVVLHGGMGISKRFYRHFANWLAEARNVAGLTYEYRKFGDSARGHVRTSQATLTDWGIHNQEAALDVAQIELPRVPLWIIGHFFGGLMLPFHPRRTIDRAVIVPSGLVRMGDHPRPFQVFARHLSHISGPLTTALLGYLPGRILGLSASWPAGVFWQLRRWCLSKSFYLSEAGSQLPALDSRALIAPTLLVAISDDAMMPPKAVWRLMELLPESVKRQKVLRPADFGLTSIGHLGFFAASNAALWPTVVD